VARPTTDTLTEREARIMGVLWDLGSATADQVREALPDQPHDSSVRTLLRVLESKSYVRHDLDGRKYVYRAAVPRDEAQRAAVRSLLTRLFDGAAEELVIRLIEDDQIGLGPWESIKRAHRDYRARARRSARG
jgi:predicted transcriptional regulator